MPAPATMAWPHWASGKAEPAASMKQKSAGLVPAFFIGSCMDIPASITSITLMPRWGLSLELHEIWFFSSPLVGEDAPQSLPPSALVGVAGEGCASAAECAFVVVSGAKPTPLPRRCAPFPLSLAHPSGATRGEGVLAPPLRSRACPREGGGRLGGVARVSTHFMKCKQHQQHPSSILPCAARKGGGLVAGLRLLKASGMTDWQSRALRCDSDQASALDPRLRGDDAMTKPCAARCDSDQERRHWIPAYAGMTQ